MAAAKQEEPVESACALLLGQCAGPDQEALRLLLAKCIPAPVSPAKPVLAPMQLQVPGSMSPAPSNGALASGMNGVAPTETAPVTINGGVVAGAVRQ